MLRRRRREPARRRVFRHERPAVAHREILLPDVSRRGVGQAGRLPEVRHGAGAQPGVEAGRNDDLHLPDAPGDRAGSCRATARCAAWRWNRKPSTAEPEDDGELRDMTRRLLDRRPAHPAGLPPRDGASCSQRRRTGSWARRRAGCSSCSRRRWCCGRAGRSSCAAGGRCVTRHLNMFTLIAIGVGAA